MTWVCYQCTPPSPQMYCSLLLRDRVRGSETAFAVDLTPNVYDNIAAKKRRSWKQQCKTARLMFPKFTDQWAQSGFNPAEALELSSCIV